MPLQCNDVPHWLGAYLNWSLLVVLGHQQTVLTAYRARYASFLVHWIFYPTPGCENQWIWAVVSKGVDTTGPNLHIGYNTLICISVARRACVFMAFMPYLATLDLLMMPKVNCMYRLYDSFNNPLLYWLHNAVCSKYSLDKITKREIIKRLFCHVTHGDMTSQLDITWQSGKTIAKHVFTSVWKLANGMAQNHISGVNLSALYA